MALVFLCCSPSGLVQLTSKLNIVSPPRPRSPRQEAKIVSGAAKLPGLLQEEAIVQLLEDLIDVAGLSECHRGVTIYQDNHGPLSVYIDSTIAGHSREATLRYFGGQVALTISWRVSKSIGCSSTSTRRSSLGGTLPRPHEGWGLARTQEFVQESRRDAETEDPKLHRYAHHKEKLRNGENWNSSEVCDQDFHMLEAPSDARYVPRRKPFQPVDPSGVKSSMKLNISRR